VARETPQVSIGNLLAVVDARTCRSDCW